jgi:polysaccharide transporter, PST family
MTLAGSTTDLSGQRSHSADSLASGLSFMLGANVIQRGVGFVRNLILCRFLTDDQLGLWALASSFFILAAPFAVLGLPGTFGRLVEPFRLQGQLHVFLQRIAAVSSVGVTACVCLLLFAPVTSSQIIFGTELSRFTMAWIAIALILVILFNATTELLSGLRKPRTVSSMHTCNSLVFTIVSLTGLALANDWNVLIVAFAFAAGCGMIPAIPALRNWHEVETPNLERMQARGMWKRVVPFAVSIWCMNLLINSFDVVDRYMLLYLSRGSDEMGRALVGQFHSGRIMPVLLSSLTLMLSAMLLPYLAADWEQGRKRHVFASLRLTFKCCSLFFVGLSIASLSVAPLLFNHVLQGKYADGLAIMPLAMMHCSLAGVTALLQNYFWCIERGRVVGIITAIGLVSNIGLNLVMVPAYGLYGAMLATSISGTLILIVTIFWMRVHGVRLDWSCLWFGCLPLTLILGPVPAISATAITVFAMGRRSICGLLTSRERRVLENAIQPKLQKLGLERMLVWPK